MNIKNIFNQMVNSTLLVGGLYWTGMFGVLFTSFYHVFLEQETPRITSSLIIASFFLLLILFAVILAKLSKEDNKGSSTSNIIAAILSVIIIFCLFLLTSF